jgi:carboxyl-terminal processing protease
MYQYYPKKRHHYFLYPLVIVVSFALGWQATSFGLLGEITPNEEIENEIQETDTSNLSENVDLNLFWTVWEEVVKNYVDDDAVNTERMVYGAIKGMVNSLDDSYTVFMDPDESEEFNESLNGKLEGIGAELTVEDGNLVVVSPLRDSPAEKAGLLPGDTIFKIDDKLASEMTLFDAIMSIRGKKGTAVNLTIIRKNVADPFEISIVRDKIDIDSVTVENLENGIVYISVNQFNDKTSDEFSKAISGMILDPPKGLIIDFRYNGRSSFLFIADKIQSC